MARRSLEEILTPLGTAEQELEVKRPARLVTLFQEFPDIALIALSGIVIPPHERTLLYAMHWGAQSTVIVASRGTSKSSTACVLYPNYRAMTTSRRSTIELSSTGFRGGQMMFLDALRWIQGGWIDQEPDMGFLRASIPRGQVLNRSQNFWSIEYDSFSKLLTLPTKDPDSIRGHRGNDLIIDEANFVERDLIDKVALPFLNVKGDFKHGGALAKSNQVYFISTIDYDWRPFQERIKAAREGINRDLIASKAADKGDWELYHEQERSGLLQHAYVRFDYSDLLIRHHITTRAGVTYEVSWPNPDIELSYDLRGIPFTEPDPEGGMKKFGTPASFYQTYPIDKEGLERPLLDGSTDEASWLSEQRNVVDTAMGDVYSHNLVDEAACRGDRCIIPFERLPEAWRKRYAEELLDYVPPVLWRCADPCVLGVDYAPLSDFCAFVVIRLGPLAKGPFDPFTHMGRTEWSNVVWAEQHRKMSNEEAADKVRQLSERYNLIWFYEPQVKDPWEACRAIGMDMRGGGNGIRDELCFINDATVPVGEFRIYDPLDKDDRIAAFAADPNARPMLDAIWPSDQLNDKMVEFTVGQMQQKLLYIPKYLALSERPRGARELHIAYDAALALDSQLRKLRQKPTKNWRSFYMEGDRAQDQNKKDLWSAFIYAAKQARAHLIRQKQIDETPPPFGAAVTRVGGRKGQVHGKVPGTRG